MSKLSISSTLAIVDHHHHPPPQPPPPPPPAVSFSPPPSSLTRDYRKGNWTLHETLILITAKRLDEDRRTRIPSPSTAHRPAELRWKWVENYCWKNGCFRSQNQCNDKWDNLLRDYKKVRDYQVRAFGDVGGGKVAYWTMEKHERKERNLPSNLASEVFDALSDVISRRNAHRSAVGLVAKAATSLLVNQTPVIGLPAPPSKPVPAAAVQPSVSGMVQGVVAAPAAEISPEQSSSSGAAAEETDAKKRRRGGKGLGSSLARGASVLAEALMACEEKREKRHRDRVKLEERRLRLEADRAEVHRQGLSSLISAVNSLSAAIHSLASHHHNHP